MTTPTPHMIDLHVGARVRLRRRSLGMSQEQLAEAIGLTFQQVQKYEKGSNRISCSKLSEISKTLQTPIGYFFEGALEQAADIDTTAEATAQAFLLSNDGYRLANAFPRISDKSTRERLISLIETLADDN